MFRIDHNVETGEISQIQLTNVEIAEIEKEKIEFEKLIAKEQAEAQAKAQAKVALLAQLGITEEQAKLLLS